MNLIEFFRLSAYFVIFLVVWHLGKMLAARTGAEDIAKAMAWVTAG